MHQSRFLLSFLILFFIQSCGTFRGRKEIIVVDSNPRGLEVEIDEEIEITPFVRKMNRASSKQIKIISDTNSPKNSRIKYPCRVDWAEAVIPNLLTATYASFTSGFSLTSLVLGAGITNGIDAVTDALYTCEKIDISPNFHTEFAKDPCYHYAVVPFPSKNFSDSKTITNYWIEKMKPRVSTCSDFISDEVLEEALFKFGWIAGRAFNVSELSRPAQLYLADKLGVDYIVSLNLNNEGQIVSQSLDVAKEQLYENHFSGIPVYPPNGTEVTLPKEKTFWDKLNITFLPNAITLSNAIKEFGNIKDTYYEYRKTSEREVNRLPKYVSYFGISDITHPGAYNNYDYRFSLHPDLRSYYRHQKAQYDRNVSIEQTDTDLSFEYEAKFMLGALSASTGVTIFTPLGSISGDLLLGMYTSSFDDSFGGSKLKWGPIGGFVVRWSGFATDNLFVYYEAESLRFLASNPVEEEMYRLDSIKLARLGLGYMFDFEKNSGRVIGLLK